MFVDASAGGVYHYANSGYGWGSEEVTTNTMTSDVTAFQDSSGGLHVVGTTSGGINHYANYGSGWSGEVITSGSFTSAPAAYLDSVGDRHVYVLVSGGLEHWVKYTNGTVGGEVIQDGTFLDLPVAYLDPSTGGLANLFAVTDAANGYVNHYVAYSTGWQGEPLP